MLLDQVANVAEIIAAALVIVSLIYVGIQVKQNTQAVRLSTVHNVTEEFRDWNNVLATNGGLAAILLKGMQSPREIEGADKIRYNCILYSLFTSFENAYVQQKAGALDSDEWNGLRQSITDMSNIPGFRFYWDERKHWYGENFRQFMDTQVMLVPATEGYRAAGT